MEGVFANSPGLGYNRPCWEERACAADLPYPPLDRSPMNRTYVALDLETTGLDSERDTILEVGAVRFRISLDGGIVQTVKPHQHAREIARLENVLQRAQHLRQIGWPDLAGSTRAGGERSQADFFACHRHPPGGILPDSRLLVDLTSLYNRH
jgi:hypothetical protein